MTVKDRFRRLYERFALNYRYTWKQVAEIVLERGLLDEKR